MPKPSRGAAVTLSVTFTLGVRIGAMPCFSQPEKTTIPVHRHVSTTKLIDSSRIPRQALTTWNELQVCHDFVVVEAYRIFEETPVLLKLPCDVYSRLASEAPSVWFLAKVFRGGCWISVPVWDCPTDEGMQEQHSSPEDNGALHFEELMLLIFLALIALESDEASWKNPTLGNYVFLCACVFLLWHYGRSTRFLRQLNRELLCQPWTEDNLNSPWRPSTQQVWCERGARRRNHFLEYTATTTDDHAHLDRRGHEVFSNGSDATHSLEGCNLAIGPLRDEVSEKKSQDRAGPRHEPPSSPGHPSFGVNLPTTFEFPGHCVQPFSQVPSDFVALVIAEHVTKVSVGGRPGWETVRSAFFCGLLLPSGSVFLSHGTRRVG